MKINDIKTPVSSVTGVGPQLTKNLAKLNIFTVSDLLQFYPKDYEDRTKKVPLKDWNSPETKKVHTIAKVVSQEWFGFGSMRTLKININDGTASASLICFRRAFLEKSLTPDSVISVTGNFFVKYDSLQSTNFEVTKLNPDFPLDSIPPDSGIIPLYHLTEGITQKNLQKILRQALQQYGHGIENELPEELIEKRQLLQKQDAILKIHNPENIEEMLSARKTLSYEELYFFQKAIALRAIKHKGIAAKNVDFDSSLHQKEVTVSKSDFEASLSPLQKQFYDKLPFKLTQDQQKAVWEMDNDIDKGYQERERILSQADRGIPLPKKQPFTMQRLLQGDVGSGKTLVSLFLALRIISWKGQCALMAPTEILARQHADTASRMLDFLGIRVAFLTGNVKAAGRNQILKALKKGEIDIIIGTHALFSSSVEYNDLELAIIDEQHRFGVLQRQAIIAKGRKEEGTGLFFEPHLLMMSATPIPQSLALTVYGDLDISSIKTLPEGRKEIITYLVKEGNEINAYEAVRKELEKGHQAYFVYPAIENELESSRKSVEKAFEHISKHIFPQYSCALVHGKIDEDTQAQVLQDFKNGKIQVLLATTVIEVGVDIPNATCMVIEQADFFGMAQLHQLRGRVGRGKDQSFCFLIYSKNISASGIERMKTLRQSTDGFFIAEQDLKTRGPGELTGTLQAGELGFSIADLSRDKDLLLLARSDVYAAI